MEAELWRVLNSTQPTIFLRPTRIRMKVSKATCISRNLFWLSRFDGRKTACLGGGKGIEFNAWEESPVENPTAALSMSDAQVGFRLQNPEVPSRMRHPAPDRLRHVLRCRTHRARGFLDVGAFKRNGGTTSATGRSISGQRCGCSRSTPGGGARACSKLKRCRARRRGGFSERQFGLALFRKGDQGANDRLGGASAWQVEPQPSPHFPTGGNRPATDARDCCSCLRRHLQVPQEGSPERRRMAGSTE